MISEVIIYYSSNITNCPFCKMAREYFESEKIEYTEVDIAKDDDMRAKIVGITKKDAWPQIKVNQYFLVGFKRPVVHGLVQQIRRIGQEQKEKK